ncbi:homoserine dehydrogenase [Lederbergia lenta]|uniref:Homoserine dehydrogenase n=1 Tax=Lederbergia lenta TaxID=1467 RepID=A0A2X4ZNA7_LEDLE|nr:homoserine dehydrogenase [Lederbergia lenta]MCM3113097.1 homoserine dehydrogenase [Lederbergia lenta]MEC2322825.1 homoserine dehydrogenase [Lederbergia lenta]SQI61894.1 Homoserine dehydrogenase [Lederbergia lenta]
MEVIKAAILGFGTVGEGVYEAIQTHQQQLQNILGVEVQIAGVLIQDLEKERNIADEVLVTTNFEDILNIPDLQVVFEAIVGEDPSYSYLSQAIDKRCDIVTANKVMFATYGEKLIKKAQTQNVKIGYEATVAGGVPIIRTLAQQLQVNKVGRIQAILNGTSNFILTEMRNKELSFENALGIAQELGYAEADPTNDIGGFDAFYKLMILSSLTFGEQPDWDEVKIEGISALSNDQLEEANQNNFRYKHVAELIKEGDNISASVSPVLTDADHPLYNVEGVDNAVVIEANLAGTLTIQGPGAGKKPTASAMIEDFVHIIQSKKTSYALS